MPYTPHYHFSVPNFGDPGWNLSLNQNMSDIDTIVYDIDYNISQATSDTGSLSNSFDILTAEIQAARIDTPAGVTWGTLALHLNELDEQVEYAKGPFPGTGGEQVRTYIAKMNDGSVDNCNIGNTGEADYLTTRAIIGHDGSNVTIDPGAYVSYFNILGKVYSVSDAVETPIGANSYIIATPASSDAGETTIVVETVNVTDLPTLADDHIPVGWSNTTGTKRPTFAKNKQFVYVDTSTIAATGSDVIVVTEDEEINLGFVPDQIEVIVRYVDAGEGTERYISNPPSVQVIVNRCSDTYISTMDVYLRQIIYPFASDEDYDVANRCLFYDAKTDTKINTFTGIKVVLRYFGHPWSDSVREEF